MNGRTGAGAWLYIEDDEAKGEQFDRVAVEVWFVQAGEAITGARGRMGARVGCEARCENTDVLDGERRGPRESEGAIDLHRELTKVEEMRVGLGLTAPPAKKFAGRLVWDVAYSAGFNWGDGDYFHWVPSPNS